MLLSALIGTLEQGLVYGIMALGVYITYRILHFADLTVDGSFPLGAAVAARFIADGGSPLMGTVLAMAAGMLAGLTTGFLNTKLKISGLLSGILTMTALYSVNLRIMGRANIPLLRKPTLVSWFGERGMAPWVLFLITLVLIKLLLDLFLKTEVGFAIRATGDNEQMIRSCGVNTDGMKLVGLGLANCLVALSGALVAQYQGFADVGMGVGTVVAGLASVIAGQALVRFPGLGWATTGVIIGSLIYRGAIFAALRLGLAPTDLKLITAVLVVVALSGPVWSSSVAKFGGGKRRATNIPAA
ncbi:MAG: ABC transporter permease [Firmicutes bacterium]|jgi:putative ABC transport system permease protein|nr:ABC transporter permease [Bacillota bacterium]